MLKYDIIITVIKLEKNIIIEQKEVRKRRINNKLLEWLLYIICYAIVLIVLSFLFSSISINMDYFGIYALIASIIIYILNQTIKPCLFYITLPITALTFGLFYPLINVFILYLTSFILQDNFNISGIIIPFFISLLISFFNILMEGIVIKPIVNRRKYNE